jgi:4-amino-4-deoxy-L-arabinose transferase-like glycosyltransferase
MRRLSKKIPLEYFFLSIIIILAAILRFYKIDIPLADHHSWRQADTAAVARNFLKEGFDFFHPRIDNMTPLAKPDLPNNQRLFMVEPPIYQTVVAGFYRLWGVQERWARLVSILFYLGGMLFLYFLVERLLNKWVGLLAVFFMAVLPYGIFYGRVIMPEPMMLFALLGMLYWFYRWIEEDKGRLVIGILAWFFTAWALSIKTFPIFLALPMFYLVWQKWGLGFVKQKKLWLFAILAVLPLLGWRWWIAHFPEGIPSYEWLFNLGGIRFRPAFFRWIFAERIGKLILGYWGLPLLVLGLILRPGKKRSPAQQQAVYGAKSRTELRSGAGEGWFFHWWLGAFLVYVAVFASGNVTHDYYQVPFIPIAAIFLAKGSWWLIAGGRQAFNKLLCTMLFVLCSAFMLGFSWFEVRGFYLVQGGVDLAGRAVDELTPKDALVLTGDSNDATLLYNTNRHGWTGGYASYFPNTPETIERVKKMEASVYVTTKFDQNSEFGKYMLQNYSVIKQTNQYIVFSLITNY